MTERMTVPGKLLALAAVVTGALALSGCTGSGQSNTSATHLPTATARPADLARTGLDGDDVTIARRAGNTITFVSPTRNIGCVIWLDNAAGGIARCDISQKAWKPVVPRPASCEGDFGGGLDVQGNNRGEYLCATDSAMGGPGSLVLAYGYGYDLGRFRCVSAVDGMRCENRVTGHGFWLSRQNAVRF